jgi:Flp pilus assembly protein TadG
MSILSKTNIILPMLRRFSADKSGNFAVFTALSILPFVLVLGGSIDIFRVVNAKATLQNAADAAVLSAASLTNSSDIETIVQDYVSANLRDDDTWDALEINILTSDVSAASREIEITATTEVPSTFLNIAGIETTSISVTSSASQRQMKFEISMVLDISTSMKGVKLTNLKTAAQDFVSNVVDQESLDGLVSVNLIPYGGTVNIQPLFDEYVVGLSDSDTIVDPSESEYFLGSGVEDEKFRFTEGLSCVEYRETDYDDLLIPYFSRAQVPHFSVWSNKENPWCPTDQTAVVLNTNDIDKIEDRIDEMGLSDGTGSDIGLLWGVKTLSPEWRGKLGGDFASRPADYDDELTTKILIFMTDGGITYQGRPKETSAGFNRTKTKHLQKTVTTGSYYDSSTADTAYGRLKTLCEQLDSNGVRVYTIGFKITAGSAPSKQLEDCALNGGNYYHVESLDINSAFDAIVSSISNLRVTG